MKFEARLLQQDDSFSRMVEFESMFDAMPILQDKVERELLHPGEKLAMTPGEGGTFKPLINRVSE